MVTRTTHLIGLLELCLLRHVVIHRRVVVVQGLYRLLLRVQIDVVGEAARPLQKVLAVHPVRVVVAAGLLQGVLWYLDQFRSTRPLQLKIFMRIKISFLCH